MGLIDTIWSIIVIFVFVAYLMFMFSIVTDLFRDQDLNGWLKALWLLCLIIVPIITALVYVIARGKGMAERANQVNKQAEANVEDYIRKVAVSAPADQISAAKKLLDEGTLTAEEYTQLKSRILASV